MNEYQYEAKNVVEFVAQIVRYVASGHYFYLRVLVPERKDVSAVDAKLLDRYGVRKKPWQRKQRHLNDNAGVHYIRCNRYVVIMLTKGKHEAFYFDHGGHVRNIRHESLKVFGYSIRFAFSEAKRDWQVSVRLGKEPYLKVCDHLLTIGVWNSYRNKSRLEREFSRLPYQPYEPVYKQLIGVARTVNRARRRRGFNAVDLLCVRNKKGLAKVFVEPTPPNVAA